MFVFLFSSSEAALLKSFLSAVANLLVRQHISCLRPQRAWCHSIYTVLWFHKMNKVKGMLGPLHWTLELPSWDVEDILQEYSLHLFSSLQAHPVPFTLYFLPPAINSFPTQLSSHGPSFCLYNILNPFVYPFPALNWQEADLAWDSVTFMQVVHKICTLGYNSLG